MSGNFRVAVWLIAAGFLAHSAGAQCMRWSSEFTSFAGVDVYALQSFDDGTGPALYAGGEFSRVYRWRNHAWETVGLSFGPDVVSCFGVFDEGAGPRLFAGGNFDWPDRGIARWDGTSWSPLYPFPGALGDLSSAVGAFCVYADAQGPALYVGGNFGYGTFNNIARWDGTTLTAVSGGVTLVSEPGYPGVFSMCVFDDGTGPALYVAGSFTHAGGIPADSIARWNGTSWSSLPGSPPDWYQDLVVFDDGTGPALYASGWPFKVVKWDGLNWSTIGASLQNTIDHLCVFDDGSGEALYAGGQLASGGVTIMRWSGSTWSALGGGMAVSARVRALAVHDDGAGPALAAGGYFYEAGDLPSVKVGMWRGCTAPISTVCFGDGTIRACPCGSNGVYGHGCPNSVVPEGSRLYTSGSTAADDLRLEASGLPPIAMTLFVQGSTVLSSVPVFGDGVRCTGGNQLRLQVAGAQAGQSWVPDTGAPSLRARSLAAGDPLLPGSVRYYQAVYRDPSPGFCSAPTGGTFNTTNGVRVVW